ncbi:hypothetical protein F4782DRAFT_532767 [Xylaria castorea]|nr:hypothetical protein F4782DRAFT_532767 [Xylaria castorea]
MTNDSSRRLKLPGFGMPLNQLPELGGKYFMHALWDGWRFKSAVPKVQEVRMMDMNQITDKPGWDRKFFDEEIVNRWREEAMGPPEYGGGALHIEGVLNDRIVATALYYYDCENTTESVLALHHPVDASGLRMIPPQSVNSSL